jgi:hypothetical protein
VTAELNIHLEDPVSAKSAQYELHKSNIHSRAATAEPLITGSNAQIHERWCELHKSNIHSRAAIAKPLIT